MIIRTYARSAKRRLAGTAAAAAGRSLRKLPTASPPALLPSLRLLLLCECERSSRRRGDAFLRERERGGSVFRRRLGVDLWCLTVYVCLFGEGRDGLLEMGEVGFWGWIVLVECCVIGNFAG